ncbi:MAG: RNA polymerase sigma factor [Comamonadaceae bacterium CG1_02_60_18]|nr:MAG: RNA polymerase sigma factor [Comamonadaceae bacterium CG1_02_60_18]PIQ51006.1 MAG: RNA polymerase sigma factor [Comamonadaceae bacterium CG12_big_fil_rev_8_21_14_0_65_59_15]
MATPKELSDFLKEVEKRAFKRALYHVRNDESAFDIVQDSMMRLAENYGDKPVEELPLLFQRILSNATMDWFRRQKVQNALFSPFSDFQSQDEDAGEFDILEAISVANVPPEFDNPQSNHERAQTLRVIEDALLKLPLRQREAFLLRYWEDMGVAETASTMGCSEGSVKTHCFRAIQTLAKTLTARGISS